MKVVVRVDASTAIGIGHVVRCVTLAEGLERQGAEVTFVCREHLGNLAALIKQHGFDCRLLQADQRALSADATEYERWLGTNQQTDALETMAAIGTLRPDWLIVDHYGLDAQWEKLVRPAVGHLMVIDDLANRMHSCDLLLDQNYAESPQTRYGARLASTTATLIGPLYALLRPEYARQRREMVLRSAPAQRLFIFFGGSDPHDMTGKTLAALDAPAFRHLTLDIVVGANNPNRSAIESLGAARGNTQIFGPRPHLADLMVKADVAIGGGGTTVWERMCVGLSSIVVAVAENQVPISTLLGRHDLIRYLGIAAEVGVDELADCFEDEIIGAKYVERARLSLGMCDGEGTKRVVRTLFEMQQKVHF